MFRTAVARYADILHLRFTDTFAGLPQTTLNQISPENIPLRLLRVLWYTVGRLLGNLFLPLPLPENISGKIWLYVVSRNNYDSLAFFKAKLPAAVFVAGQNKEIGFYNKQVNRLSARRKLWYYYLFVPVWWGLYRLKGVRALRFFDLIYQAIGYYEISVAALKKHRPTCVIFANDHNTDARALLLAAKDLNIPTVYIQHASVSTSFPPLIFDLNLLEGQDSLDKYRQCGPITGQVKLIGMPKADVYLAQRNFRPTVIRLGICCNIIDDYDGIRATTTYLARHFPDLHLTFRAHPSDTRNFDYVLTAGSNISVSDAKTEPVFDFLLRQDAIIAADSSVHLEATLLNIVSIYYRFGGNNFTADYYGYVQHGLIEQAPTLPDLQVKLQALQTHKPEVYQRARYYNAVLGTKYEGRSHELALTCLHEFLTHLI